MHQKANTPDDDAFALDLSSAVISGGTYTLQFYTVGLAGFGSPLGPVEVGLSNNSGGFGTMIFSGAAGGTASWTQFTFVFVAPTNAAFLTFRTSATRPNMYAFVDNVSLVPTPGVALPLAGLFFLGRRKR